VLVAAVCAIAQSTDVAELVYVDPGQTAATSSAPGTNVEAAGKSCAFATVTRAINAPQDIRPRR